MIGTVLSIKPILTIQCEKLDSYKKIRGNMKKALGYFYTKDITAIVEDLYQVTNHIKFIE